MAGVKTRAEDLGLGSSEALESRFGPRQFPLLLRGGALLRHLLLLLAVPGLLSRGHAGASGQGFDLGRSGNGLDVTNSVKPGAASASGNLVELAGREVAGAGAVVLD